MSILTPWEMQIMLLQLITSKLALSIMTTFVMQSFGPELVTTIRKIDPDISTYLLITKIFVEGTLVPVRN